MQNKTLSEGFWDTLITKAKHVGLAAASAAGSSSASGKLSASLLSDAIFGQYKEYNASTGTEVDADELEQFLKRIGFSSKFAANEAKELKTILSHGIVGNAGRDEPTSDNATADEPTANEVPDAQAAKVANQKAMHDRMQAKRGAKTTRESLEEAAVSDGVLRKFFNTLAQRALKSGEAKSAAKKTILSNGNNYQDEPEEQQPAPSQRNTSSQRASPQAAPETPQAPVDNTATQTSQPAPNATTSAAIPAYDESEREVMDAFPVGTNLGSQIKATSPDLQALAQKVMQHAFDQYKAHSKQTTAAKPAAKATRKPPTK